MDTHDPHSDTHLVRARATVRGTFLLQVLANGLGMVFVVLYFSFLVPSARDLIDDRNLNLWALGIFLATMLLVALPLNSALLRRAVNWARMGRRPSVRERKLLFTLPTLETLSALLSWFAAAVLFGVINDDVRRITIGIALAGVVTCTLLYLLLEGHFRPLFAVALEEADLPDERRDVGPRLLFAWLLGSGVPLVAITIGNRFGPEPFDPDRLAWVGAAVFLAGGAVMLLAARSVTRPITEIRAGLQRIEEGDLEVQLSVDDLGELGRLTQGVNHLAAGIREREELREIFGRQVGQAGLADLAGTGNGPESQGELREVTVLFVDLRGYTAFAERHEPTEVVEMLNRFFGAVVAVVNREGGWVNKFEGDAAMCIFGAPQDQPDHAERALRAARSLPHQLASEGGPLFAGIGVATGEVLAGFVGTPERYEYTVIGDVVNLAARLCESAKKQSTGVLASSSTTRAAGSSDGWKPAGRIDVRGRTERAVVYTPVDPELVRERRRPRIPFLRR
ncbi:MAG: adenylate/guanylate cyclase domain-containing protein [Microthrixaceae bacterium]|nr:adenylate/guanylate cyclase domain-containing protein [Microthrixaceae bacterium]MCO5318969.1 adenylate/guanylate cyclase domain-containing protein [Microthrixaceae bacterium]